jgi:hypothetical protein
MLDRTAEQFKVAPSRLVADAGYGSAEMLGWMVDGRGIEPHVKLMDKSERTDGALSRSDFAFDPEGKRLSAAPRLSGYPVWRARTMKPNDQDIFDALERPPPHVFALGHKVARGYRRRFCNLS